MSIRYKDLPGPSGLPLIGSAHKVKLSNMHNNLEDWAKKYGGVYKLRLGLTNLTVVSDPIITNSILQQRPKGFIRMAKMDKIIRAEGIHGVFNAEGEDWRLHRNMVAKGLDVKHQAQFFPALLTSVERLYNKWEKDSENGDVIDIQRDFLRFTVDVTSSLAFGFDMNTLEEKGGVIQDHMEKIFPMIFKRINDPFPIYKLFRTSKDREFDRAIEEVDKLIYEFIDEGKRKIAENPELRENPTNVLEAILVAAEKEESFGDEEVKGNLLTLLMAGEDTTAHTLAWSIYLLTKHQDVIPELVDEIDNVLGDSPWMKEYSDRNNFPYLEGVANETMRLNPVAPVMLNEPTEDVEIEGYLFEKGSQIIIHTRAGARSDENFTSSDEFNPKRWIAASKCPVHNMKAFIPFGAGPRYCPGRNLAMLEINLVLSMLFKNFELEMVTNHEDINEIMAFTMMASDFKVKLKKRAEG